MKKNQIISGLVFFFENERTKTQLLHLISFLVLLKRDKLGL